MLSNRRRSRRNCTLKDAETAAIGLLTEPGARIVLVHGAGISVAAGIPDFRGSRGVYATTSLPKGWRPHDLFSRSKFEANPKPLLGALAAIQSTVETATPTPQHWLASELASRGMLVRCYTQNLDRLEEVAGLRAGPGGELVFLHGALPSAAVLAADSPPGLTGDIVFNDEEVVLSTRAADLAEASVIIVAGTSLEAGTAYGLAADFRGHRIFINVDPAAKPPPRRASAVGNALGETPMDITVVGDVQTFAAAALTALELAPDTAAATAAPPPVKRHRSG